MAPRADSVSLVFQADALARVPDGLAAALAAHLVGQEVTPGQRVALPGWPTVIVDAVEPDPGRIEPGTDVSVHVPPTSGSGAMSLVVLVDASLTMGRGDPSPYEEAAHVLDGLLLNGRAFLQTAGIVVQGGETRHTEPLTSPEEVTGASILKVQPRGTFDLDAGLDRALELLEEAPEGPHAIVVLSDDGDAVADPLATARAPLQAGVGLYAVTRDPSTGWQACCSLTGGLADEEPGPVFERLAERAGAEIPWTPPAGTPGDEQHEFEVVVETMEGSQ